MTVNELKYVYIEETMSALGNEELMEAILDAVRKVKVKFQERQEVSDSLFGDVPALPHSIAQLKESLGRAAISNRWGMAMSTMFPLPRR